MDYNILLYEIAGNTVKRYIMFASSIAAGIFFLILFKTIVFSRIKKITDATDSIIDDMIADSFRKNIIPAMYLAVLYFSTGVLRINSSVEKLTGYIAAVLFVFFGTRFIISVIIILINRFWYVKDENDSGSSIPILINTLVRIVIWTIALLVLLDNAGIKVSGLIAGLGVGGVAIAFASQSILRDFFNYFTIFFDRPFEIGDFLVIDDFKGTVEHIGIKTTRLRSLSGEQLIFANTDLTGSRVKNFKTMQERRILFSFGVTYQTPAGKLKAIPEEIRKIIESIPDTRFDRAHFHKFGESSLDFEVVYFVLSGEYSLYMDIQQEISLRLVTLMKKMKVEFAYPTRTLFMENVK